MRIIIESDDKRDSGNVSVDHHATNVSPTAVQTRVADIDGGAPLAVDATPQTMHAMAMRASAGDVINAGPAPTRPLELATGTELAQHLPPQTTEARPVEDVFLNPLRAGHAAATGTPYRQDAGDESERGGGSRRGS